MTTNRCEEPKEGFRSVGTTTRRTALRLLIGGTAASAIAAVGISGVTAEAHNKNKKEMAGVTAEAHKKNKTKRKGHKPARGGLVVPPGSGLVMPPGGAPTEAPKPPSAADQRRTAVTSEATGWATVYGDFGGTPPMGNLQAHVWGWDPVQQQVVYLGYVSSIGFDYSVYLSAGSWYWLAGYTDATEAWSQASGWLFLQEASYQIDLPFQ